MTTPIRDSELEVVSGSAPDYERYTKPPSFCDATAASRATLALMACRSTRRHSARRYGNTSSSTATRCTTRRLSPGTVSMKSGLSMISQ